MGMRAWVAAAAALIVGAGGSGAATAQAQPPGLAILEPAAAMPADKATLDGALAKADWATLHGRLSGTRPPDALLADLDWERVHVDAGGGMPMAVTYVDTLWQAAALAPKDQQDLYRRTAAVYALYTLEVVRLDGLRCSQIVPSLVHYKELVTLWQDILTYADALPSEQREAAKAQVVHLEGVTFPNRMDDPALCAVGPIWPSKSVRLFFPQATWQPSYALYAKAMPQHLDAVLKAPLPMPAGMPRGNRSNDAWTVPMIMPVAEASAVLSPPSQEQIRKALSVQNTPMPADKAALDEMVAKEDWAGLNKRLQAALTVQDLDWEKDKVVNGGNVLLGMHYVNTLWRISGAVKPIDRDPLRQSAVAFALYDLAVAMVDGARCEDATAPSHRLEQFAALWAEVLKYGRSMPDNAKNAARTVSVKLEWATAPVRANDPVLCAGGLAQMQAGIAAGTAKEVPTPPGGLGKTYEVARPADFQTRYLPEDQWKPEAEKRRAALPAMIDKLLEAPTAKPAG